MNFNFIGYEENETVDFRKVSSIIKGQKLKIFTRMDEEGNIRPVADYAAGTDSVEVNINDLESLLFAYGNRFTRLTIPDFADYIDDFCKLNSYKYGQLYLTELMDYDPIANYDKKSTITTDYNGSESNITDYTGSEKNTNTKEGTETHTTDYTGTEKSTDTKSGNQVNSTDYSGSEKNTNTKEGTETHTTDYTGTEKSTDTKSGNETMNHGMTVTESVNATNNSSALVDRTKNTNSGTDTTTYNDVKDVLLKEFTNRQDETTITYDQFKDIVEKTFTDRNDTMTMTYNDVKDVLLKEFTNRQDETVISYDDFKDIVEKSFEDRNDTSIKTFINRNDVVTERTTGNIGVTTTAQMLQGERELADFSVWKIMFYDLIKEISIII